MLGRRSDEGSAKVRRQLWQRFGEGSVTALVDNKQDARMERKNHEWVHFRQSNYLKGMGALQAILLFKGYGCTSDNSKRSHN